ncbi:hypothetical protein ACFQAT_11720 [Undibacterium arcticum]|uniref:Uncharacterized protein n=1 Tax=Undibacterium arcticum TaxID=1762892 RepID=A0ABV7F2W0_9BURK
MTKCDTHPAHDGAPNVAFMAIVIMMAFRIATTALPHRSPMHYDIAKHLKAGWDVSYLGPLLGLWYKGLHAIALDFAGIDVSFSSRYDNFSAV